MVHRYLPIVDSVNVTHATMVSAVMLSVMAMDNVSVMPVFVMWLGGDLSVKYRVVLVKQRTVPCMEPVTQLCNSVPVSQVCTFYVLRDL